MIAVWFAELQSRGVVRGNTHLNSVILLSNNLKGWGYPLARSNPCPFSFLLIIIIPQTQLFVKFFLLKKGFFCLFCVKYAHFFVVSFRIPFVSVQDHREAVRAISPVIAIFCQFYLSSLRPMAFFRCPFRCPVTKTLISFRVRCPLSVDTMPLGVSCQYRVGSTTTASHQRGLQGVLCGFFPR